MIRLLGVPFGAQEATFGPGGRGDGCSG